MRCRTFKRSRNERRRKPSSRASFRRRHPNRCRARGSATIATGAVTQQHIHPELLELLPALARLSPPATVINKAGYSAFSNGALLHALRDRHADSVVITGGETDICVLATVLSAVDLGYRVILPVDAVCSSSDQSHDHLMRLYSDRFTYQIETVETEILLKAWEL
jgi:nicotinamidase-related amidase